MEVVVIYLGDVGVRDDNKGEVSKSLYSMCKSNWEEGEGKIG